MWARGRRIHRLRCVGSLVYLNKFIAQMIDNLQRTWVRSRDACGPSDIPNLMRAGRDRVWWGQRHCDSWTLWHRTRLNVGSGRAILLCMVFKRRIIWKINNMLKRNALRPQHRVRLAPNTVVWGHVFLLHIRNHWPAFHGGVFFDQHPIPM